MGLLLKKYSKEKVDSRQKFYPLKKKGAQASLSRETLINKK